MLKRQKAKLLLLEDIANLQPGLAIPSVRELMERYHLSQRTIMSAVGELAEQGILKRKAKSGIYVADRNEPEDITAFLLGLQLTRTSMMVLQGIQEELQRHHQGLLLLFWSDSNFHTIASILRENRIRSVILMPNSTDIDNMEFIRFVQGLEKSGIRLAVTNLPIPGVTAPFVGEENRRGFQWMAEKFAARGFQSITVAGKFGSQVYAARLDGIRKGLKPYGIQIQQVDMDGSSSLREMAQRILQLPNRGIILTDAGTANIIVYELMNIIPRRQFAEYYIGGIKEPGDVWPLSPKQSCWLEKNSVEMGRQAVQLLNDNSIASNTIRFLTFQINGI